MFSRVNFSNSLPEANQKHPIWKITILKLDRLTRDLRLKPVGGSKEIKGELIQYEMIKNSD